MNTTTQALNGKEIPHHNQDSARHPAKRLRPSLTTYSPTNPRHITKANQNIGADPKCEIFL